MSASKKSKKPSRDRQHAIIFNDRYNGLVKKLEETKMNLKEMQDLSEAVVEFDDDDTLPRKYGRFFVFNNALEVKVRVNAERERLEKKLEKLTKEVAELEEIKRGMPSNMGTGIQESHM